MYSELVTTKKAAERMSIMMKLVVTLLPALSTPEAVLVLVTRIVTWPGCFGSAGSCFAALVHECLAARRPVGASRLLAQAPPVP